MPIKFPLQPPGHCLCLVSHVSYSVTKIHTCKLDQYQQIPNRLGTVLWFSNLDFRRGQLEWPFPACLWSPSSLNITNQFL